MERFGRGLVVSLAAILIGASIYLAWLIREREEALSDAGRYNLQWSASQAVIELTRLQLALGLVAMPGNESTAADEVRLRFDIFKNRLSLLNSGEFKEFVAKSPESRAIVDEALMKLAVIEPAIDGLQSAQFAKRALDQIRPLTAKFVQLAAMTNRFGAEQVAQDQAELSAATRWFSAAMAGIVAICLAIIALLFRHNRLLIETRAHLETSAVELKKATEIAQAASKAKSEFLAKMSHEIRTPMNGVLGMADILMRTDISERQQRLLGTMRKSATTLLAVINDILDISQIETGKLKLDVQDFEIRRGVEGSVDLLSTQAFQKGIELTLTIDDRIPDWIVTDGSRLQQVIVNLLSNAIKFTEKGRIEVRLSQAMGDNGSRRLYIDVRDTGVGIDDAARERLFKPFIQADNSVSRRFGGTGLGLAISRHIIEMLGGGIDLVSGAGKGATVSIWIPLLTSAARVDEPRTVRPSLAGKRILVVDDREQNRQIAATYLTGQMASVAQAATAVDALGLLSEAYRGGNPFNVVVVDRIGPGRSGFGLADAIKSDHRHTSVAVILLMALSSPELEKSARERGVRHILSKPLRRDDLLDAVAACSEARRPAGDVAPAVRPSGPAGAVPPAAHVLVAEDNPVNVEVMRGHLEALGCTCDVASNGAEATRAVENGAYALVLMDCQMPVVDGLTATQQIRTRETERGGPHMPIIAVTANAYPEDRVKCAEAGMDDYMSKPFTEEQLASMLLKWLPANVPVAA